MYSQSACRMRHLISAARRFGHCIAGKGAHARVPPAVSVMVYAGLFALPPASGSGHFSLTRFVMP